MDTTRAGSVAAAGDRAPANRSEQAGKGLPCAAAAQPELCAAVLSSKGGWQRGRLVRSKAGRDNGRYYLVLAEEGDFVLVADGRKRPVSAPKRKNKRHLQTVNKVAADLTNVCQGRLPSDETIRAAIAGMLKGQEVKEGD